MTALLLALFCLTPGPAPGDSPDRPAAAPEPDGATLYRWLDEKHDDKLRLLPPSRLVTLIRAGRPASKRSTFQGKRRIQDRSGRETDLYLVVPENPTGVMFVLHGLYGDGRQLLHSLYREFAAREGLIVAAPTAQKEPVGHNGDADETSRRLPHWWSYRDGNFILSALALLKREYVIDEDRVFLCGYSMGGFGTWNIGLRFPDRFAALVPMAGGISRREYERVHRSWRELLLNARHLPVYCIHGARDRTVPAIFDRRSRDRLKELGYSHVYVEVPSAGHLVNVREGFELMNGIQEWLKKRKRAPHPRRIDFVSLTEDAGTAYWIQITRRSGDKAEVEAVIGEGNSVSLKTQGVDELTLFVDETHLDMTRPITVTRSGKTIFEGRVQPSSATVLETWRSREDRKLVYRGSIDIEIPR